MATIKHYKVVAALPSTLVADSIYLVRVGTGFDLYVTNSSGTIVAYPANYQAGSANLSALSGLTGAANKAPYFTAAGAMAVYDLTVFGRSLAAAADQSAGRTLLGLGTAATRAATTSATDTTSERLWRTNDLVKQTSQKDTTAGRVMLTGAGGWMGVAPFLTGNDYNNDSEYCGIVRNDNNTPAVNYPPQISANAPMAAMNVRFNGSYGWQLGVQTPGASPSDANTRAFLRCEVGGAWSSWAELWHSLNFNPALKADLASPSFTGNVAIGNAFQANAGSTGIEVGRTDGTAGIGFIDFHCGATVTDYDARIAAINGTGADGGGQLVITASTVTLSNTVLIGGAAIDNTNSGWINCTLTGGWTSVSGRTAQYRRIGKRVYLRGAVQNATFANNNTAFWNIPSGYQPLRAPLVMVTTCGAFLSSAGGAVYSSNTTQALAFDGFTASGTVYVNLDSVSWDCA